MAEAWQEATGRRAEPGRLVTVRAPPDDFAPGVGTCQGKHHSAASAETASLCLLAWKGLLAWKAPRIAYVCHHQTAASNGNVIDTDATSPGVSIRWESRPGPRWWPSCANCRPRSTARPGCRCARASTPCPSARPRRRVMLRLLGPRRLEVADGAAVARHQRSLHKGTEGPWCWTATWRSCPKPEALPRLEGLGPGPGLAILFCLFVMKRGAQQGNPRRNQSRPDPPP